ncbi:MAG: dihydrofolate reductase [Phycisphaerae bacterium]|nr:dihydrofolate reductase [Phycisphaerae bacterium]
MITLIAAMDSEHLIGRGNELPWDLPHDLKFFRETTMGGTVIVGRKTWESIKDRTGKAFLDGRVNFVLTRDPEKWQTETAEQGDAVCGPYFENSLEAAIERTRKDHPDFATEIFIAGGRGIYTHALDGNLLDRMLITHVRGQFEGDVYFPKFEGDWVGRVVENAREYRIFEYVPRPK